LQPSLAVAIECTLWIALFSTPGVLTIGGFDKAHYLTYVIWAAFLARITSNWMYEFRMVDEIEMGTVNTLLVRPVSFFEYYLTQFLSYKLATSVFSLLFPALVCWLFAAEVNWYRVPGALALVLFYLILLHCLSFCVACLAFHFNKVGSVTVAKNLGLWLLSGELFPLDLLPEPWREIMIALPFSSAVYIPVSYIIGRGDGALLMGGFISTAVGTAFFGGLAWLLWRNGVRNYVGTGA
jgi:ABC-2 type transport system permease protein